MVDGRLPIATNLTYPFVRTEKAVDLDDDKIRLTTNAILIHPLVDLLASSNPIE